MERKRITKTVRIDSMLWDVVEGKSKEAGISASRWCENFLFESMMSKKFISKSAKKLGETRGGDTTSN